MILALVASGLTLIFGIMDVVNFAHGELFMLGAYAGVIILAATGDFWIALAAATLVIALLGAAIYLATSARSRSALHDPRDIWRLARATELCALAVRPGGTQDRGAVHRPVRALLSGLSVVPGGDCPALRRHNRGALAVSEIWHLGHLDSRDHPGPCYGSSHGHSGAGGADGGFRHRCRYGGRERRVVWSIGRRQPRHGPRLGAEGIYRRCGWRNGKPRRLDSRRHLHQPSRGLCLALGQPGSGGDRLVRRIDPDLAVPAHGAFRSDPEMSPFRLSAGSRSKQESGYCHRPVIIGNPL